MHSLKIVESDTVLLMETSTFGLGRHRDTRRWYAWPAPMWGANEQRYWLVNTLWWFYMPPTTQTDSSLTEQANTDIKNQNLSNMSLPFGPLINVSKWTLSISESLLSRAEPDRRLSWVIHAHRSTRNGEVSKWQASFLSEWGHLSNTAIQAWKEQSLLFKVALPGGLPFTGAKKLITQTSNLLPLWLVSGCTVMTFFLHKREQNIEQKIALRFICPEYELISD